MIFLAVTIYLCHRWPWLCSVFPSHNPACLSFFITYHRIFNKSSIATSGYGTATFPGYLSLPPLFVCLFVCSVLWISLFFLFGHSVVLLLKASYSHLWDRNDTFFRRYAIKRKSKDT
jgi:hypothetical protein